MAYKDILLALTTYPNPTPDLAVNKAIEIAVVLGARLSAIACEVKISAPSNMLANALINVPAMAAAEAKKSSANAKHLLDLFQDRAEKYEVFQERILENCLTSQAPELLVKYARLRDLTIVPQPDGDYLDQWYAESIIFGSGRPTLVLPQSPDGIDAFALDSVAVAWDFSRSAARAVADALPLLEAAKHVFILTVKNEKKIETERSGVELSKYLAHHGVNVVLDVVDAAGRDIGAAIEDHAKSRSANLLVMGAFAHSRLRDFVLGGATRSILSRPPLPVMLSY